MILTLDQTSLNQKTSIPNAKISQIPLTILYPTNNTYLRICRDSTIQKVTYVVVDKETKEKVNELEKQLKWKKDSDSLDSIEEQPLHLSRFKIS